mmetsp:Transcript_60590/g.112423  ORF Transcript_60590/g.112423 Transcript_60590/m.112423 type:complete len:246 (-) Transcript_60590:64-801(-)
MALKLPCELVSHVENLWRRFPELVMALGSPALEEHYRGLWTYHIKDDSAGKVISIRLHRKEGEEETAEENLDTAQIEQATAAPPLEQTGYPLLLKSLASMSGSKAQQSRHQPRQPQMRLPCDDYRKAAEEEENSLSKRAMQAVVPELDGMTAADQLGELQALQPHQQHKPRWQHQQQQQEQHRSRRPDATPEVSALANRRKLALPKLWTAHVAGPRHKAERATHLDRRLAAPEYELAFPLPLAAA